MTEFQQQSQPQGENKVPLAVRYNIPEYYLDFEYVNKCTNVKTLERILKILRSGEEGFYPELMNATEERIRTFKPTSKLLRVLTPVLSKKDLDDEEIDQLNNDLNNWISTVSRNDKELKEIKSVKYSTDEIPNIRSENRINENERVEKNLKTKRISSTDYDAWDKYDPDAEIIKMDVNETQKNKEIIKKVKERDKKTVRFNDFNTQAEIEIQANREREKGNEFFRQGDFQEALHYYTNSLSCKSTAAAFTNRAITFIKLKKYDDAISDCTMALKLEPDNVKAYLRMAQSLDALKKYEKALNNAEKVIVLDPNNNIAQNLVNQLRNKCGITVKSTTRLQIEDVESKEIINEFSCKSLPSKTIHTPKITPKSVLKSYKYCELIPIPGTSKMSPPFYEQVRTNNWQEFQQRKWKILNSNMGPLFSTTIDMSSDDEILHNINLKTTLVTDESISLTPIKKHSIKTAVLKNNKKIKKRSTPLLNKNDLNKQFYGCKLSEIETEKKLHKKENKNVTKNVFQDLKSQGEPCIQESNSIIEPEELTRPFNFLREWMSDRQDVTYKRKAEILRNIELNRLPELIGIKLDSKMFSEIVNCLYTHFTVPGEVEKLRTILINLIRVPRFNIILLFLSDDERKCLNHMISFLDQHGNSLPTELKKTYIS